MTQARLWIRPLIAVGIVVVTIGWFVARPVWYSPPQPTAPSANELAGAVQKLDAFFEAQWNEAKLDPASPVDDLTLLRRLNLALTGTVPSLEEIRAFEADKGSDRIQRWTARLIADPRFIEYFGIALAKAFIDIPGENNQDIHLRLRFVEWLGEGIQSGVSWNAMAREIIAGRGVLADEPGTAMVAAEFGAGQQQAAERLAARTSRALLGQRIDCAQCHDHPYAEWTQDQFEGLAAHYSQVNYRMATIQDSRREPFIIDDTRNNEKREVAPAVPFDSEWRPDADNQRDNLADWVTHPDNRRFRRAIANRMWGLLFGRPLVNPVDDLPNPPDPNAPDALDILGNDLAAHDYDLRRTIQVIVASRPFRLESAHPGLEDPMVAETLESTRAVFPLTELDAHQLIRSMQQAAAIRTIRPELENTYVHLKRFESRYRFARDYGEEPADGEIKSATVPQAVQRLTGNTFRNLTRSKPWNAPGRIAALTSSAKGIDQAFLACLTRRPTAEESAFFLAQPARNANQRSRSIEDIYWTLFNSAEFSWNH